MQDPWNTQDSCLTSKGTGQAAMDQTEVLRYIKGNIELLIPIIQHASPLELRADFRTARHLSVRTTHRRGLRYADSRISSRSSRGKKPAEGGNLVIHGDQHGDGQWLKPLKFTHCSRWTASLRPPRQQTGCWEADQRFCHR